MAGVIRAFAPAKVNLSLEVHGRRANGYHELTSLVVFADVGDTLTLTPAETFSLDVSGPMASRIEGPNLITTATERLVNQVPDIASGSVSLRKVLPVGAGIGGGSSDVAAYLRAVRAAYPHHDTVIDWDALALSLGADVPVCLSGRATWMRGIGDVLVPHTSSFDPLNAVLVNPCIAVPTGAVFTELNAPLLTTQSQHTPFDRRPELATLTNDLEEPALRLVPEIGAVRDALEQSTDVEIVRMSGSGATYFGIYPTDQAARAAAEHISSRHPKWWVAPTVLGDAPFNRETGF